MIEIPYLLEMPPGSVTTSASFVYSPPPWTRPDRNPMPSLVLFPRARRAAVAIAAMRERSTEALDVLRGRKVAAPEDWMDW